MCSRVGRVQHLQSFVLYECAAEHVAWQTLQHLEDLGERTHTNRYDGGRAADFPSTKSFRHRVSSFSCREGEAHQVKPMCLLRRRKVDSHSIWMAQTDGFCMTDGGLEDSARFPHKFLDFPRPRPSHACTTPVLELDEFVLSERCSFRLQR